MWPFRARSIPVPKAVPPTGDARESPAGDPREHARKSRPRWDFEEGSPIAPGRTALKRLGGGSAYEVYLVWDEQLFALAVAKLLRPDRVTDPHALRELRREADMLQRLAHPALVRGFGAVLDGAHPQLLLEYAEGPTLHQVIDKHGPLPPEQLAPLALHVASVLQYLSSQRVVHLDVKPGNVVMGIPPRLIDLSIARGFDEAAQLRVPIGTDRYMAPEQCDPLSSPAPVGAATDVWGFGATLYHACTGYPPFGRVAPPPDGDSFSRFPQLVREVPPLPSHVPARLAEVIRRMLRKDPAGRPPLREVVAALDPLVPEHRPRRRLAR
jgi:serine/threonine protein kinase